MQPADDERAPTQRFSDRVDYYVKYRPHYPAAILPFLEDAIGLAPGWHVADVGSGTGILSRRFLDYGCTVYGVEPNGAMRRAAERWLAAYDRFHSVAATAEATTLPANSVELVTAGQAFHWFDRPAARAEFRRILRPKGAVALVYNEWGAPDDPFVQAYDALFTEHGTDYEAVNKGRATKEELLHEFFGPAGYGEATFSNPQWLDWEALRGRVLSSSYAPLPGHPNYEGLSVALRRLFAAFAVDGRVRFPYQTIVYWGRPGRT